MKQDAPYGNFGEEYAKDSRRHYYANVTFIDEEIGKVIKTLKEKGIYDNALICYISDHGDMLGDHHHWRKTYPYEGSVHIPYIDFNAGVLVEDKTMEEETKALFDLVVETASGKQVCSEAAGFHDMAIFKQGVTL